jgi:hypothetical protein
MKNMILYVTLVVLFSCCNKDEDKAPVDLLPPATQTGANTAGCLVNGQAFLPKGSSQFGPVLSCFYQQDQYGFHLGLGIADKTNSNIKAVNIATNPVQLIENTTYNLVARTSDVNNNYISNFGQYTIYSNTTQDIKFETTNTLTGELKITKLNTQQRIVSGTFWFDAVNLAGEKVEVREGRFDMHYVN